MYVIIIQNKFTLIRKHLDRNLQVKTINSNSDSKEKTAANLLAFSFLKHYLIIPLINFHKWFKF